MRVTRADMSDYRAHVRDYTIGLMRVTKAPFSDYMADVSDDRADVSD